MNCRWKSLDRSIVSVIVGVVSLVNCTAQPAFQTREASPGIFQVGFLRDPQVRESSGLVPAARTNLFWTHNDGPTPLLFAITREGQVASRFRVTNAEISDWEDIARDDAGNLYMADTGNNNNQRQQVFVHRFPEPDLSKADGTVQITRSWTVKFPAEPFNCESLFIWRDHAYLISKLTKDRRATLYRFPLIETNCTLEVVAELPVTSPVTAADLSRDGATLGLVCKSGAYLFDVNGDLSRAGKVQPRFTSFREGQIEGCCFVSDGLLSVSEKREVFLYSWAAFRAK